MDLRRLVVIGLALTLLSLVIIVVVAALRAYYRLLLRLLADLVPRVFLHCVGVGTFTDRAEVLAEEFSNFVSESLRVVLHARTNCRKDILLFFYHL